jgi:nucleoid-associated protein YgaU
MNQRTRKSLINQVQNAHMKKIDCSKIGICILSFIIFVSLIGLCASDKISTEFSINTSSTIQNQTFTVCHGDTLWSIAAKILTDSEDIREKVIHIRNINGLSASQNLVPGQIIQIPIKSSISDYKLANNRR